MTLANGRGLLNLIPKLETFGQSIKAQIQALAAIYGSYYSWNSSLAVPKLIRLCDPPDVLIQPKNPSLIFTVSDKTTVTPQILYDYNVDITYLYAPAVELEWGDHALFACGMAAEAIHAAVRENLPAGINNIIIDNYSYSYILESTGTAPMLARTITASARFQVEEDF